MKKLFIAMILLSAQISFAAPRECFSQNAVRNFRAIDEHTVEIDAGRKDYVLDVSFCSEVVWSHTIAFDTFGFSRVCAGDRLLVMDNFSNHVKQSCRIENITRISR